MRSLLNKVLLLVCFIFFAFPSLCEGFDVETYAKDIEYIYHIGKDVYCYWDLKKETDNVVWEDLYNEAMGEIKDAKSIEEFYEIVDRMLCSVKDGHVNFRMRNYEATFRYMPINVDKAGDKVVITKVRADVSWDSSKLKAGDEIVSINNTPVWDLVEDMIQLMSGSTYGARKFWAVKNLTKHFYYLDPPTRNPLLKVKKYDTQEIVEVEVPWIVEHSKDMVSRDGGVEKLVYARILPGNVGYLRVGAMDVENETSIDEYVKYIHEKFDTLMQTNGMIIDVRNNPGGNGWVGDEIMSRFIDKPTVRYKNSPRLSPQIIALRPSFYSSYVPDPELNGEFAIWQDVVVTPAEEGRQYHQPLIVLANEGCFSACDTFVDSISSNKLGLVIGAQTGGGTGYPQTFELPSEMGEFRFSVVRGYSNHDRFLEGIGTIPDIERSKTIDDIAMKTDSVLGFAVSKLMSQGSSASVGKTDSSDVNMYVISDMMPDEFVPPHVMMDDMYFFSGKEFDGIDSE
ncbi:PDZ domain-containing protein [bacterium]|nr:PDZ domain-containing protein [bacterium]